MLWPKTLICPPAASCNQVQGQIHSKQLSGHLLIPDYPTPNCLRMSGQNDQTHLQGSLCSLQKQTCSKSLLGTPNTVPCSRMGCKSPQGMAGLCCSPPHSNVPVDMVLLWPLSCKKNTPVTSLPAQGWPLQSDLGYILMLMRTTRVAWNPVLISWPTRLFLFQKKGSELCP